VSNKKSQLLCSKHLCGDCTCPLCCELRPSCLAKPFMPLSNAKIRAQTFCIMKVEKKLEFLPFSIDSRFGLVGPFVRVARQIWEMLHPNLLVQILRKRAGCWRNVDLRGVIFALVDERVQMAEHLLRGRQHNWTLSSEFQSLNQYMPKSA
jgi:hypothetical protein